MKNCVTTVWFCLGLVSLISSSIVPAQAETLSQTIEFALQKNSNINRSEVSIQVAALDKSNSRASLLPSLNLSADTSWNESETKNLPSPDAGKEYNKNSYGATLSQTLIDWSKFNALSSSNIALDIAKIQHEKAQSALIKQVVEAYFSVLKLTAKQHTTELELDSAKQRLKQIKRQFELGNVAKTEVYEARSTLDRVRNSLITLDKDLNIANKRLLLLCNMQITVNHDLDISSPVHHLDDEDINNWQHKAEKYNFDNVIAQYQLQQSVADIKAKRSSFSPTLNASVNYQITDSNDPSATNLALTGESESTVYSLNLNVPIFSGGSNFHQLKRAHAEKLQADYQLAFTRQQTQFDVTETIYKLNADVNSLSSLKSSIESNTASFKALKTAYKLGSRTLPDVLDAEKRLYDSVREYFDVRYNYINNLIALHDITGSLSTDVIIAIDKFMVTRLATDDFTIPTFK